jgi:hypothetical protein
MKESGNDVTWWTNSENLLAVTKKNKQNTLTHTVSEHLTSGTLKQDSYKTDHSVSSLRFYMAVFFILRNLEFFKTVGRGRTKYTCAKLEHIMARELKGLNLKNPNTIFKSIFCDQLDAPSFLFCNMYITLSPQQSERVTYQMVHNTIETS